MKASSKHNVTSKRKRAASHIAIYSVGTYLRQLVGFIMLPIYTRFLTPSDYGVIALLSVLVSVFELLMGARFAQAVPRFFYETDDDATRSSTVSTALIFTSSASLIGVALLASNSEIASKVMFGAPDYAVYIAVYSVLLLTSAVENYGLIYVRLLERPILFVSISLGKLLLQLGLNVYLVVFLKMGVAGVVAAAVISSSILCLLMAIFIILRTGLRFDIALAKRLFVFSWPLWVAGGAGLYIGVSNKYFIRVFADVSEVGLYALAGRFASLVGFLVWAPFVQWWQTERFNLYRRDDHGRPVFRAAFNLISSATLLICVGISLFAEPIIKIMADEAFHTAVFAVAPLAFAEVFVFSKRFNNFGFLAKDKTGYIAAIKYFQAFALTALFLSLIPVFGYIGAAYAVLIGSFIIFLTTYYYSKRTFDSGVRLGVFWIALIIGASIVSADLYLSPYLDLSRSIAMKSILALVYVWILILLIHFNKSTNFITNSILSLITSRIRGITENR